MSNPILSFGRSVLGQHPLRKLGFLGLGLVSSLVTALPTRAAENISFTYGPLWDSISVRSLEDFAATGQVNPDLNFYFKLAKLDDAARAKFREALVKRPEVDPVTMSRFLYSDIGEDVLNRLGRYLGVPRGINGKYALRSALILSALDLEGATLLNILKKYPTDVWIDAQRWMLLPKIGDTVIRATEYFTQQVQQLSDREAAAIAPTDFAKLPDLRRSGSIGVEQYRWELKDTRRNRQFYVDVYRPQRGRSGKTPVIVFSHGLGSQPEDFAEAAKHWASYGYVVVLPQHPGSDHQQSLDLKEGRSQQVFLTSEFIDRPKDISYVIDELERRNASEFGGQLELKSVGVGGHSFGGYTAMAIAGATIDFDFLQQECDRLGYPNTSLLLECRALALPRTTYNFRDPRVTAVFAANPVNYSIFGPKGLAQIQIPIMLGAGSYDPAAPAVFEQARSFIPLASTQKYFLLVEGQTHIDLSQLDGGIGKSIESIPGLMLPSQQLVRDYALSTGLAFFEVHLAGNASYRPYLQSSYGQYLSQGQKFKTFLLTDQSNLDLKESIAQWVEQNPPVTAKLSDD